MLLSLVEGSGSTVAVVFKDADYSAFETQIEVFRLLEELEDAKVCVLSLAWVCLFFVSFVSTNDHDQWP